MKPQYLKRDHIFRKSFRRLKQHHHLEREWSVTIQIKNATYFVSKYGARCKYTYNSLATLTCKALP